VRLATRLGILVARRVTVADDAADIDLWVRAQPDGDAVRLAVSGWRDARPAAPLASEDAHLPVGSDLGWEVDAALRLTFMAPDAARRWDIDATSLLGQPLTALFALGDDSLPMLDAIARHRPLDGQRATIRGTGKPVVLDASIRRDVAGNFAGMIGGARAIEEVAATDVNKPPPGPPALFTDGLDKALRAPLARIIANADTINAAPEGPVGEGYVGYAADIAHAGRHLLGLVDDLVDIQGIEREAVTLEIEPIDLTDVARRAAGLLAVRAANGSVAIAKPLASLTIPAHGDFGRVLQILVNLIGNAIRYSVEGAVVTITCGAAGDTAFVTVDDQGKGIAAEDQARIFEKFERVDTSEPGGNGLGLYIARRLARAMSGDLTVESAPGEGARFTLTLPANAPSDQDEQ